MARIELSNIGGGGTTLSLTTTGTSGASTLAGSVLNIPVYQGQLTLTTTGTSGAATLVGDTLNIPQYSGGGGTPAGSTGEIQYNNAGAFAASANLSWDNSAVQLNIGAPSTPTGRLNVKGGGATSATFCQVWTNSANTELMKVVDNGNIGIGTSAPATTLDITGDFTEKNPSANYDAPVIGAELTTTGSGTNWSGSSFSTGYTHATGSTSTLTASSLSVVNGALYQVQYTISGRTAGSITVTLGGVSSGAVTSSGSLSRIFTTSTATLVITPTTDFDGSVIVSVKRVTQASPLITYKSSSGVNTLQITNIPDNIIIGNNSGRFTSGIYNVFLGAGAGEGNTSGVGNMFIGTNAGQAIATGQNNVAVGYLALQNNQNGFRNLALGRAAGRNSNSSDRITIGDSSDGGSFSVSIGSSAGGPGNNQSSNFVAIGYLSGNQSTSNANSVYIGSISGYLNTTGQENTYIGYSSGYANTTGSNNLCIGSYAGRFTSTGAANSLMNSSILIGVSAAVNASGQTNQIVIGGTGLGSNTTTIGNTSTVQTHLYGNTTIGSNTTASARMHIRGSNASSGTNALLVQNSTPSDIYKIENDGKISYWATNTAAGTTGAQTINRPSGTVNFAAGATALVVTNSLCTTASLVFAEVRTNDATAQIKNVVPAAGSFTINLNAAATAETSVGFFIIN